MRKIKNKIRKYFFLVEAGDVFPHYQRIGKAFSLTIVSSLVIVFWTVGFPQGLKSFFFGNINEASASIKNEENSVPPDQQAEQNSVEVINKPKSKKEEKFELKLITSEAVSEEHEKLSKGQFLVGRLMNNVISNNSGTPVFVKVELDLVDEDDTDNIKIPKGSILIGQTESLNQEIHRLFVSFHTIKISQKKVYSVSATLLNPDGSAGLMGEYSSGKGSKLAGAAISTFIAGLSAGMMDYSGNAFGTITPQSTMKNALLSGVGNTANHAGELFTEDMKQTKPVMTIKRGLPLLIYLNEDLKLN